MITYSTQSSQDFLDQNKQKYFRMEIQGQLKIKRLRFLEINYLKAIILTFLLTCTFFGLLALKYSKKFRAKVWFFDSYYDRATHVYVWHDDYIDDIEPITRNDQKITFMFRNLKYSYQNGEFYPVGFDYKQKFSQYSKSSFFKKGIDADIWKCNREKFGQNKHEVKMQNYFQFLFEVLTKPYFILQYIICAAYIVEKIQLFAYIMLAGSIITISINYIILYIGFLKIKALAETQNDIKVLRNGQFISVKNTQLVPGQIINPQNQIPCDCLLLQGDVYVNEASLTGQTVPIAKFAVFEKNDLQKSNRWLFEGTKILQKNHSDIYALVVDVGFATRRGRIIRKIMSPNHNFPQIFKRALIFLIQTFLVSTILYLSTLGLMLSKDIDPVYIGFRFIDFLGWSAPAVFPIYFNLVYSFALVRLRKKDIICTYPQKTVQPSNLKTMYFDKTGTLTQNQVQVQNVYTIDINNKIQNITHIKSELQGSLLSKLFATCHAVIKVDDKLIGDQIDLKMFIFSQYQLSSTESEDCKFAVYYQHGNVKLQVVRINQFESKFQSMSVLVRQVQSGKHYVFIKGALQKIQRHATNNNQSITDKVNQQSLRGLRIIACGYKEVPSKQIQKYLNSSRDLFEQQIQIIGLISFKNRLKKNTKQVIKALNSADIESKMITGDNIFTAIQTAVTAGMIAEQNPIIIIQGRKQMQNNKDLSQKTIFNAVKLIRQKQGFTQQNLLITQDYDFNSPTCKLAVDNDFLKLNLEPNILKNIKIFARITPQVKAMIIHNQMKSLEKQYKQRSTYQKLFGTLKLKVGMCGDGSNDLIALKIADVGIGLNGSDASYGSAFNIKQIEDINYIIRDSKAAVANIIEIFRTFTVLSLSRVPSSILMITDTSYFSQIQIVYFNFTTYIIYPLLQAYSKPCKLNTPQKPNENFLNHFNHARIWINTALLTIGMIGAFFYFVNTDNYVPNNRPTAGPEDGWNPRTQSGTITFLIFQVPLASYILFAYISSPWKVPLYRNYLFTVIILLNICQCIALFFLTAELEQALDFFPVDSKQAGICLAIMTSAVILTFICNKIMHHLEFREKKDISQIS